MKALAALLLGLLAGLAQARDGSGCTPDIEDALRKINAKQPIDGDLVSADCKPWPSSAGRVVAAAMAFEKSGSQDNRDQDWYVVLALVDVVRGGAL